MLILSLIIAGMLGGVAGALVMNVLMRLVGSQFGREADMVVELGSFITRKREGAAKTGTLIHLLSGVIFGILYLVAWNVLGYPFLPQTLPLGFGFGLLHGLVVSLMLMYGVMEKHPLPEFAESQSTMNTGIVYLLGHIVFGLVVGIVGGLIMSLWHTLA